MGERGCRGGRVRRGGQQKEGGGGVEGEGRLLEGSADGATLEWLGGAVVVHHAALGLALSGEEQAAEFGHL